MLSGTVVIDGTLTPSGGISGSLSGSGGLSGTITANDGITAEASEPIHLNASLTASQRLSGALQSVQALLGSLTAGGCSDITAYTGDYEVMPSVSSDKVLATSGKKMTDDVTVFKVPYWETSNESGLTAYIGVE